MHVLATGTLLMLSMLCIGASFGCGGSPPPASQQPKQGVVSEPLPPLPDEASTITPLKVPGPTHSKLNENVRRLFWDVESRQVLEPSRPQVRPQIVFVFRNEYSNWGAMAWPAANSLLAAERFALAGFDVSLLFGVPDHVHGALEAAQPPSNQALLDDGTLAHVCDQIAKINQGIARRQELERQQIDNGTDIGRKLQAVPPLKQLGKPLLFSNKSELDHELKIVVSAAFGQRPNADRPQFMLLAFSGKGLLASERRRELRDPELLEHYFIAAGPQQRSDRDQDRNENDMRNLFSIEEFVNDAISRCNVPMAAFCDLCRPDELVGLGSAPFQLADAEPLSERELSFAAGIDVDLQAAILELESLRANAVPDAALLDNRQRHWKAATMIFPTAEGKYLIEAERPEDDQSFLRYLVNTMQTELAEDGNDIYSSLKSKNGKERSVLRLRSCFDAYCRCVNPKYPHPASGPVPRYLQGPIDGQMAFASCDRLHTYAKPEFNLLACQMYSYNDEDNYLSIVQDANDRIRSGGLTIMADSKGWMTKMPHNVRIGFLNNFRLPEGTQKKTKLVLHVAAVAKDPNQSVPFVIGAYCSGAALTSHFNQYGRSECYQKPVNCDGVPVFRAVPLDGISELHALLTMLEIQAPPDDPESIPPGCKLVILGAYIVPDDVSTSELEHRLQVLETLAPRHNWIGEWWCNSPLADHGTKVMRQYQHDDIQSTLALTASQSNGWWGITGELYPRRYVTASLHKIRMKLRAPGAAPQSRVVLCLYSGARVTNAWECSLADAIEGVDLDILESDLIDEMTIGVKGCQAVEILELRIDKRAVIVDE